MIVIAVRNKNEYDGRMSGKHSFPSGGATEKSFMGEVSFHRVYQYKHEFNRERRCNRLEFKQEMHGERHRVCLGC